MPSAPEPRTGLRSRRTVVLMTGRDVVAGMAARVRALGREPVVLGSTFEGEAEHVGGPNQELALSFARVIAREPAELAGAFADSDGPTAAWTRPAPA